MTAGAEELLARLERLEERFSTRARERAHEADRFMRENPWLVAGIAALVAFAVGALAGRRRR